MNLRWSTTCVLKSSSQVDNFPGIEHTSTSNCSQKTGYSSQIPDIINLKNPPRHPSPLGVKESQKQNDNSIFHVSI